ncbi:hypothetical protein EE612_048964 [Oryza sativa]|nr:hypothetical protein EE612_048964 [Oryza sativa]
MAATRSTATAALALSRTLARRPAASSSSRRISLELSAPRGTNPFQSAAFSSTTTGDPPPPTMDSPIKVVSHIGGAVGMGEGSDRRGEVGEEAAEPVARDVPLAGDQRAVGGAVQHLRADDRRRGRGEAAAAATADGAADEDARGEPDQHRVQVRHRRHPPGAVQGPVERGAHRQAARGPRRPSPAPSPSSTVLTKIAQQGPFCW